MGQHLSNSTNNITDDRGWCYREPGCKIAGVAEVQLQEDPTMTWMNSTNITSSCTLAVCPYILAYSIDNSNVRVYDLVLLFFSLVFLGYLLIRLVSTVKKLRDSLPLFRVLYFMVFLIPVVSCIYETVSMTTSYRSIASKVTHVLLRGAILMTELAVVFFGLFIKLCGNSVIKLSTTVATIIGISLVFTIAEGILEFYNPNQLACDDFKFFTHGGMIFLFCTSIIFALAYATIFIVYILGLYRRWDLPSKKSFYRYALFLSLVNVVQAIGSILWFTGENNPNTGNAGICLTIFANVVYVITFAPMVYWIFLSNYFRMNSALLKSGEQEEKSQINVASGDCGMNNQKERSSSNPRNIRKGKRSILAGHTALIPESYETSSSYGSFDEETFVRRVTPDRELK